MMRRLLVAGSLLAGVALAATTERPDLVLADFEGDSYGAWTAEGDAFGPGPARGTLPGQMAVSGFAGKRLVNSFFNGDRSTGRLTSPTFRIERRHLTFLIGGGGWPDRTCMNLIVGTNTVRTAEGPNTEPGGSEALEPASWEVGALEGQTARLEIVDAATGGWGHINIDQIAQSDRPAPGRPGPRELEVVLDRPYLLFPVARGPKQLVELVVDGAVVRAFDIELSDQPDWYAHLDVRAWSGRKAVVRIRKLAAEAKAPELITTADTIWREAEVYREPLRGQFHFSARRGWLNDPNGLVFADGEYHLYFQHNPYGWPWGNMHWGHAVSPDLVHWRELPIALYPRQHGDWVFSGSAVIDAKNTSGWRQGTNALIVVAFTSTGRGECIAYSNDRGRTFTEFEGNPVVRHSGRDPRLLWHAASRQWVMAVYDEQEGKRWIAFHTSPDLKAWTFRSRIEGFYECPDLFELPLGDARRWVLTGASSDYMVGRFDGERFTPETPMLKGHRGRGFYAAQTFSQEPKGRVVQVGWFQTETPGMPFNQSMSLPLELGLAATPGGPRLTWTPAAELASLRARTHEVRDVVLNPGDANPLASVRAELQELRADFAPATNAVVTFTLRGATITYDAARQEIAVNGHRAPAPLRDGRMRLAVYLDRTGLEVFVADGLCFVPMPYRAPADDGTARAIVEGSSVRFDRLTIHELETAWPL